MPSEGAVGFKSHRRVDDMEIRRAGLVHLLDVTLDCFRIGLDTDLGSKTANCRDVVLDSDLAQPAPSIEMSRETIEH